MIMIKKHLIFLLLLLSLFIPGKCYALGSADTQTQWKQVAKRTQAQKTAGLSGGEGWQRIMCISYAPSNPDVAYFSTDTNQVWKTVNANGTRTTWQRKGGNYPSNGGISLVVDPTNENIVYASGMTGGYWPDAPENVVGILRTADGGDTWTLVKQAQFHISYANSANFAFGTGTTNIYAAPSNGGILKSTNGTTWNLLNKNGGGYILDTTIKLAITAHPTDSTILYVSATDGLYKIVDANGSATVTKIGTGLPAGWVYQLQINSSTPNIMYIATGANGVYRSTDGGLNFSARNSGLSSPIAAGGKARFLAMSPVNSNRLFVTFDEIFGKHLYYTNDGGASWTQTSNMDEENAGGWVAGSLMGWTSNLSGTDPYVPVAFHPTNQNIALIAGFSNIVKKTTDGGVTWKWANDGYTGSLGGNIGGDGPSVTPIGWDSLNQNRSFWGHTDFGALITENGEDTFKKISLVTFNGHGASHVGALRDNIIVESVGQSADRCLAISRDSGASFTLVSSATAPAYYFIAWHPQNSNIVYAGNYKFTNIGTSNAYTTLTREVDGIFKGDGNIIYAINYSGSYTRVEKSTNGGTSWISPYPDIEHGSGYSVSQIAIDPTNQNRIYAAVKGKGIYIINDTTANGGTAVLKNDANGLSPDRLGAISTYSVATDPNVNVYGTTTVYAGAFNSLGSSNGIFRSTDAGLTWTNVTGNLGPYLSVANLIVNPFNSYVYMSSFSGTWKLPPPYEEGAQTVVAKWSDSNITIDGQPNEAAWGVANSIVLNKNITGAPTLVGSVTAKVLWNTDGGTPTLYILTDANDPNYYNDSVATYNDTSVEVYIDGNYNRSTNYESAYDRQFGFGRGDTSMTEFNGTTTGVTVAYGTGTGNHWYTEWKIVCNNFYPNIGTSGATRQAGSTTGFDIFYNEDNNGGVRDNQTGWNGTDTNYLTTAFFGDLLFGTETTSAAILQIVTTGTATGIGTATATLAGTVSTNGNSPVDAWIKYGTESGNLTTLSSVSQFTGSTTNSLSKDIVGLSQGTTYYYAAVGSSSVGIVNGSQGTFTTTTTQSISPLSGHQAYWKLDENTGTNANDSSGNGNTGLLIGTGTTWATGKLGSGINLNGISSYIKTPVLNYDEISVSAWFYRNSVDTAAPDTIFGGWSWDNSGSGYGLYFDQYGGSQNTIQFIVTSQTSGGVKTQKYATKNLITSTGKWYHVAGTYNKTTGEQKLYVDGQLVNTQTHPAGNTIVPYTYASYMAIGALNFNYGHMDGKVDEVRIFNRALTDQEAIDLASIPVVVGNGTATDITTSSVTFFGTASTNGSISANLYVQYGLSSGNYTGTSSPQINLTGSTTSSGASWAVSGLSQNTQYFYRLQIISDAYTINGTEQNFTTSAISALPITGFSRPLSFSIIFSTQFQVGLKNYGIIFSKHWRSTADIQRLLADPDTEITNAIVNR